MPTKTPVKKAATKPFSPTQQKIFEKYFPIVRRIVNSMRSKLPPYADADELHSAGVWGLADAIRRLDDSRSDSFDGYIAIRIRGAIIDELRNIDYMSRSARNDAKNIEKIKNDLEQKLSHAPSDREVMSAMGVSRRQFDKIMRRTQTYAFISINDNKSDSDSSLEETIPDNYSPTPAEQLQRRERFTEIRDGIKTLPEKQRRVIDSYYFQHKKLGEIAREFGLTEARICQIHSQALSNLRPKCSN